MLIRYQDVFNCTVYKFKFVDIKTIKNCLINQNKLLIYEKQYLA